MKTKEELKKIKEEYEALSAKLQELSEEELVEVTGGIEAEEHNIFLACKFDNNKDNGGNEGGTIYDEEKF